MMKIKHVLDACPRPDPKRPYGGCPDCHKVCMFCGKDIYTRTDTTGQPEWRHSLAMGYVHPIVVVDNGESVINITTAPGIGVRVRLPDGREGKITHRFFYHQGNMPIREVWSVLLSLTDRHIEVPVNTELTMLPMHVPGR